MNRILSVLGLSTLIFLSSCEKQSSNLESSVKNETEKTLSLDEQKLRSKLERTAMITMEVMKDKEIQKLFVEAITARTKASYRNEEAITFKELFKKNGLYPVLSAKFSDKFLDVYYSHNYYRAEKFPKPDNSLRNNPTGLNTRNGDDFLNFSDGTQLYFPYSEFYSGYSYTPTYSYAPISNEYVNEGFRSNSSGYSNVTVNDGYAQVDPTYIVNLDDRNGAYYPSNPTTPRTDDGSGTCGATGTAVTAGFFTAIDNFDGVFSGGNEFRFTRSTMELKLENNRVTQVNGQMQLKDVIPIDVTRSRVKWMKHWSDKGNIHQDEAVPVGTIWEQAWETGELSIPFALYEEDNLTGNFKFDFDGKFKFDASAQFDKDKVAVNANLETIVNFKGDYNIGIDDLIHQSAFERATFFRLNTTANPVLKPGKYGCWRRWGMGSECAITLIQE
jgi:hypothetical protein